MHTQRPSGRLVAAGTLASAVGALMVTAVASGRSQVAPVNTERPTITGTPRVGEVLTAQNGTWLNNPTSFRYQWQRCRRTGLFCVAIGGATERTYTLVAADAGRTLRVRVIAVNADGTGSARSNPTAVVTSTTGPRNTARPQISGTPRVGEQLTASEGSWTGNVQSFAFQWQRCDLDAVTCFDVGGATGRTYGVRTADLGFRLRVEVTARTAGGATTVTSPLTAVVEPTGEVRSARPTIRIISVRVLGARIYARFRICDDTERNLTVIQTDSRPRMRRTTRRFRTRVAPRPCGAYTRNWVPARRFRGPGRYTLTLRARDATGRTSAPARRSFTRR